MAIFESRLFTEIYGKFFGEEKMIIIKKFWTIKKFRPSKKISHQKILSNQKKFCHQKNVIIPVQNKNIKKFRTKITIPFKRFGVPPFFTHYILLLFSTKWKSRSVGKVVGGRIFHSIPLQNFDVF